MKQDAMHKAFIVSLPPAASVLMQLQSETLIRIHLISFILVFKCPAFQNRGRVSITADFDDLMFVCTI